METSAWCWCNNGVLNKAFNKQYKSTGNKTIY